MCLGSGAVRAPEIRLVGCRIFFSLGRVLITFGAFFFGILLMFGARLISFTVNNSPEGLFSITAFFSIWEIL